MTKKQQILKKNSSYKALWCIFLIGAILLLNLFFVSGAITDNIISHYEFEESSGDAMDVMKLYNLSNTGASYSATGKINLAYDYESTQFDYLSATHIDPDSYNTGLVVNAWIKPESVAEVMEIAGWRDGGSWGIVEMAVEADGELYYRFGCAVDFCAHFNVGDPGDITAGNWYMVTIMHNTTRDEIYLNGVRKNWSISGTLQNNINQFYVGEYLGYGDNYFDGIIDELTIFNKTLTQAEIDYLYNSGSGRDLFESNPTLFNIYLNSPSNNSVQSTSTITFNASMNISGGATNLEWDNATIYVWYSNGTLFNTTLVTGLIGNATSIQRNITVSDISSYYWNVLAEYSNATFGNYSWAASNYTFDLGSAINSLTYNNNTFETEQEQFIINLSILEGAEISLAKLIYNGTNYTISNISSSGDNYIFEKKIDIPLNVNGSANQTNQFYFEFVYEGSDVQTFGPYEQNSSFIKLIQCGAPYTTYSLNFTFFDEYLSSVINGANNKTTFYSTFKYWIGSGDVYKNYSFQNITSTLNMYQFCIYPYAPTNFTFKTDLDLEYYADGYRENKYYLRNSTLTNSLNNITLYLLNEDVATKFFLTFKKGVNLVKNSIVTVQKYFVGTGSYSTVAILKTDDNGETTMWQEVDKTFKYSAVTDGELIGTVEKISLCSEAPCTATIMITESIETIWEGYGDYYADNILSNLSFDRDTEILTYSFIDITGLANYFRLEVTQSNLNSAGTLICNSTSYSSAGTLTCNMTGYEGDFTAKAYISRSPEKLDQILGFVIDEDVIENLGITGLLIVMILIITIVIASAVVSGGNPSVILFMLGISLLGTKLIGILPFSWVVVVTMEVLIIYMIYKLKV